MSKAGTDSLRAPLGEFAGDLGVCFSSSKTSSMLSLTISTLATLFLVDAFLELTVICTDSFLTLCLGVLTSSFFVEGLETDFFADYLRELAGLICCSSTISGISSSTS
jgi:hypothetical protein